MTHEYPSNKLEVLSYISDPLRAETSPFRDARRPRQEYATPIGWQNQMIYTCGNFPYDERLEGTFRLGDKITGGRNWIEQFQQKITSNLVKNG